MDVLSERKTMIRLGSKVEESRSSWASRTWVLVACALFGNGCAARSVTDHYPDEIRKGRVLIAGRSSTTDVYFKPWVYQDVAGEKKSVGRLGFITPAGEPLGPGGYYYLCLLAYAPPGKATFYEGNLEVTVDIYEGMTTPITFFLEPHMAPSWSWESSSAKEWFEVGDPVNNLKIAKSGCPAWAWQPTHRSR
jgi:hypothetical protein